RRRRRAERRSSLDARLRGFAAGGKVVANVSDPDGPRDQMPAASGAIATEQVAGSEACEPATSGSHENSLAAGGAAPVRQSKRMVAKSPGGMPVVTRPTLTRSRRPSASVSFATASKSPPAAPVRFSTRDRADPVASIGRSTDAG